MTLVTNERGDIFIETNKCCSIRDKLAPQEQYITHDEFYLKIKNNNILEKYIRIFTENKDRINNPNRNRSLGYRQFIEMCHIIGIIGFSWNIDNLTNLNSIVDKFHNKEIDKLDAIDISNNNRDSNVQYFVHISNIAHAENTKKLLSNIEYIWGSDKILDPFVSDKEINLLNSLQEFLQQDYLWRIDLLNRFDVGGTYSPNLKSAFYFGTKVINTNLVNMIDLGKYNYKLEIDNNSFRWNNTLNEKYKDFAYTEISKIIEENIDSESLCNFIIYTYDKSIYNEIGEFDKYAKRFDMEFKIQIPYEIQIHGQKFKLIGVISNAGSDGGHDVSFFKVPNKNFWQYIDEYYALRVYEDKQLNNFNNRSFNHIDLLADLAATTNTFLLIRE